MTQDDITRMAREAKLIPEWMILNQQDEEALICFARLVYEATFRDANIAASKTILDAAVLEEREACAKVCEDEALRCEAAVQRAEPDEVSAIRSTAWKISVCAATIRARSKE